MNLPFGVSIPGWLGSLTAILTGLGAALAVVISFVRLRHEIENVASKVQLIHGSELIVERYRLAQHNVDVGAQVRLLAHRRGADPLAEPYVAAEVSLTNKGDRPMDLLACLVAGRELSNRLTPGIGLQGREVEWDALATSFWNDRDDGLFSGLSTTGSAFKVRSQLVRLDPGENEALLRIDAMRHPEYLLEQGQVHLLYKLFVVVVGYSADARAITNQHHRRWRSIQYTLNNLNRFPFRLALEGEQEATGDELYADDPLGRLTTQAGWRCFLLHHWDFDELPGKCPPNAPDPYGQSRAQSNVLSLSQASQILRERYHVYDPTATSPQDLAEARAFCRERLGLLVSAWRDLNQTIEHCDEVNVGWSRLVRQEPYQSRWRALLNEGYIAADPASAASPLTTPDIHDLDIYALERFALRIKYVLATVNAPAAVRDFRETVSSATNDQPFA